MFIERINKLSLIQKFNGTSLLIMLVCLLVLGRWLSGQIESRVLVRVGHTTSLFAGSVIAPTILEMLDPEGTANSADVMRILNSSGLGNEIVSLKVWDAGGRIIHSTNSS